MIIKETNRIQKSLLDADKAPTYQNIAQDYYDTGRPKDTDDFGKSPLVDKSGNMDDKIIKYEAHYYENDNTSNVFNKTGDALDHQ